jgi:L-lactate dehydrogenase complex protein LldG
MSRARNAILARLKKHTKAKKNKAIQLNSFSSQTLNTEQNVMLFVEKMKENKAEVHRVNHQNWKDTLAKIAIDKKLNTWLLGNNLNEIEQAGAALTATSHNIELIHYTPDYETIKETLFHKIDASITLAKAAIAETGTLVLIPDQNEPRMMSLIPPVHAVLLKESDIVNSFQQLTDQPPWSNKSMPSNIVFISSPSKTADIQQTLAYGAHGPKTLIVLVLS